MSFVDTAAATNYIKWQRSHTFLLWKPPGCLPTPLVPIVVRSLFAPHLHPARGEEFVVRWLPTLARRAGFLFDTIWHFSRREIGTLRSHVFSLVWVLGEPVQDLLMVSFTTVDPFGLQWIKTHLLKSTCTRDRVCVNFSAWSKQTQHKHTTLMCNCISHCVTCCVISTGAHTTLDLTPWERAYSKFLPTPSARVCVVVR